MDTSFMDVRQKDGGAKGDQNSAIIQVIVFVTGTDEHAPLIDPTFSATPRKGIAVRTTCNLEM